MNNQTKSPWTTWSSFELLLLMLASTILTILVTLIALNILVVAPMKKEAVERGFAQWVVKNNSTGKTQFSWNEPNKMMTFSF